MIYFCINENEKQEQYCPAYRDQQPESEVTTGGSVGSY